MPMLITRNIIRLELEFLSANTCQNKNHVSNGITDGPHNSFNINMRACTFYLTESAAIIIDSVIGSQEDILKMGWESLEL